jgi:hypothetical protein
MEFGLLPEFSTPVQKPVEITGFLAMYTPESLILREFFGAKVRRARFEATSRVTNLISAGSAWPH